MARKAKGKGKGKRSDRIEEDDAPLGGCDPPNRFQIQIRSIRKRPYDGFKKIRTILGRNPDKSRNP